MVGMPGCTEYKTLVEAFDSIVPGFAQLRLYGPGYISTDNMMPSVLAILKSEELISEPSQDSIFENLHGNRLELMELLSKA